MAALLDLRLILSDLRNGLNLRGNRSFERSLFEHELRLGLTKLLGASFCVRAQLVHLVCSYKFSRQQGLDTLQVACCVVVFPCACLTAASACPTSAVASSICAVARCIAASDAFCAACWATIALF